MAEGISLHIGLNRIDPLHYDGWRGELTGCEADARSMETIARGSGYDTNLLLTKGATRRRARGAIRRAANRLAAGDIFFVSYSGHGGQVPDTSGDEADYTDETGCLYDGQLIDDELLALWKLFARGVRVLVLSDSCHSGTVTRDARGALDKAETNAILASIGVHNPVFRYMPPDVAQKTYLAHRPFYDRLARRSSTKEGEPAATVRLISGCQDDQVSADGPVNGLFTGTLLGVWDSGGFSGDYARFHSEIVRRMPSCQTPNHVVIGPRASPFDRERPFTI